MQGGILGSMHPVQLRIKGALLQHNREAKSIPKQSLNRCFNSLFVLYARAECDTFCTASCSLPELVFWICILTLVTFVTMYS